MIKQILIADMTTQTYYEGRQMPSLKQDWQVTPIKRAEYLDVSARPSQQIRNIQAPSVRYDFSPRSLPQNNGQTVSLYIPTNLLRTSPPEISQMPHYTEHLLMHLCGYDQSTFHQLVHAIAELVQTGKKLPKAFLFRGVYMSGWQYFRDEILSPIFGRGYCASIWPTQWKKQPKYLRYWEQNYLLFAEQVSGDFTKPVQGKTQLIEELITHQQITFNGVTYEMGGNLFCATEMIDAVKLTVGQPLFIRTPYQNECIDETAWWPESDSVFRETLASELPELVGYLYNL